MNMSQGGIYAISHRDSGRMYVGSAVNLRRRQTEHFSHLRCGRHHSQHLQAAFAKYGENSFDFDVIEFVDCRSILEDREQVWIDVFKPAFNICKLANSIQGVKRSAETRARMSLALKGKKRSAETCARISRAKKGKRSRNDVENAIARFRGVPKSAKTKAAISLAKRGWKPSEETRRRMSESAKRRNANRVRKANGTFS